MWKISSIQSVSLRDSKFQISLYDFFNGFQYWAQYDINSIRDIQTYAYDELGILCHWNGPKLCEQLKTIDILQQMNAQLPLTDVQGTVILPSGFNLNRYFGLYDL